MIPPMDTEKLLSPSLGKVNVKKTNPSRVESCIWQMDPVRFRTVIKFPVTCSLILHTCNKLVTKVVEFYQQQAISPVAWL